MYDLVEFRHLKYFLTVAREGNFTRAAERLHVSQPSLSTQIKQLEESIPAQLFVREKMGVLLTPAGSALLSFAEQALHLRDQAFDSVRAIHSGTAPPLDLGFSLFIDHGLVESSLACYQRLFPGSAIRPTTQCTAQLLTWLNEGKINAALVTAPVEAGDLVVQPVARERLLVCMRKDDPLASVDAISPRQISDKLRICFDPSQHPELFAYLDSSLSRVGITLQAKHPCTAPIDMQWMVKQRLGYALVRESRKLDVDLISRPVVGMELIAESVFVYRNNRQSSHLAVLAYELKNIAQNYLAETELKSKPKPAVSAGQSKQMKLLG